MKDLKFIKGFGKITVKNACAKAKVNRATLLNGYAPHKEKEVRENIEEEISKLYEECRDENRKI